MFCFFRKALDLNPLSLVFCVESNPHVHDSAYCYDYFAYHSYTKGYILLHNYLIGLILFIQEMKKSKNLHLFFSNICMVIYVNKFRSVYSESFLS